MPEAFAIPGPEVELFIPWGFTGEEPRDQHYVSALARLAPGTTVLQAEEELRGIAADLARVHPQTNAGWSVRLVSLQEDLVGDSGRTLTVLLAAVGLLLLVACANVALLSLARGLERGTRGIGPAGPGRDATSPGPAVPDGAARRLPSRGGAAAARFSPLGPWPWPSGWRQACPALHEATLDPRALLFAGGATILAVFIAGLPAAWRRSHVGACARSRGDSRARGRRRPPPRLSRRAGRGRGGDGRGSARGGEPARA